jgi:acetylornithine deacetylase/succinyl-diaminopimelate desuccinylase-like protein
MERRPAFDPSRLAALGLAWAALKLTRTTRLLRDLIALPSVNPAFLPAGDAQAGELRVAEFLAATAAQCGLAVEFQEVALGRANLLARLVPAGPVKQRVLLAPHLDTIGAGAPGCFDPQLRAGRLHGRGACDTKGSVAAMLTALCQVAESPRRPRTTEIVFAGLVDEEHAQAGSRALARSGFKADLAIVGEPTRGAVVTAHKGSLWLRIETRGKAAHGSKPELGINAIHRMARVVDLIESDYAASLQQRKHPLLGHATVNVGLIAGGTQPNIVPDQCWVEIDRRTLPSETEAGVRGEITACVRPLGVKILMDDTKLAPCEPMETDAKLLLVSALMRCAGQRGPLGADFYCDAAVLSAAGIPSVVFGPGDIAQAHTADEWISLAALERATRVLVRFLSELP